MTEKEKFLDILAGKVNQIEWEMFGDDYIANFGDFRIRVILATIPNGTHIINVVETKATNTNHNFYSTDYQTVDRIVKAVCNAFNKQKDDVFFGHVNTVLQNINKQ